jgi:hypothetical protein
MMIESGDQVFSLAPVTYATRQKIKSGGEISTVATQPFGQVLNSPPDFIFWRVVIHLIASDPGEQRKGKSKYGYRWDK